MFIFLYQIHINPALSKHGLIEYLLSEECCSIKNCFVRIRSDFNLFCLKSVYY